MKLLDIRWSIAAAALTALAIFDPADALAQSIPISEIPLFTKASQPPLNMLVVGKDHKLFYEAYNDASDLNGDGTVDVGYQPTIEYFGYFNSYQCYTYSGGVFTAQGTTATKKCSGQWSGDFLNYLTTSRIDALRKVLYGGTRSTDTATQTILERAYIPQDAHSWGKEYQSVARDGYNIADYAPYVAPAANRYLLFANTTLLDSVTNLRNPDGPPLLRVMQDSPFRIWNWVSIERPVAGDDCFTAANARVNCLASGPAPASGSPANAAEFQALKDNYARTDNLFGTDVTDTINTTPSSSNNNPFQADPDERYLTIMTGTIRINSGDGGNYLFAIDGDDSVELWIDGTLGVGWYSGHADCGALPAAAACLTSHSTAAINLAAGNHTVEFRHQEQTGGDNFRLYWKPPYASTTWAIVPKRTSGSNGASGLDGGVTRNFYDLTKAPPTGAARTDFTVRVEVCSNTYAVHEGCKKYTDSTTAATVYKPTGLLHDYGEDGRMKFGLLMGSYMHNRQGGVLRKEMGGFVDEVDQDNGRFKWHEAAAFKGIISSLDGLKINSFERNYSHDYACNSSGWTGPVADGVCRIWGNPIGEMMFETLRYFAGATAPTPDYVYTNAGSDDATLNMPEVTTWRDPYKSVASGGLGNLACAKPFETVISDINPSYDSNLPGGAWGGAPGGALPAGLSGINASALGSAMWANEGNGTENVYIGQVGATADGAPTSKSVSSFGDIRGLSPEEPTKEGSYYSASMAFFGATHDLNAQDSEQKLQTFSVAVASPLPHIEFPAGGNSKITLVPFAKSVAGGGTVTNGAFQSTNQIVDFYVEKIANFGSAPTDSAINGGRAYAKFRINYEDIEQGNDHDMDAIASYEVKSNADSSVTVTLNSEYAAGGVVQHMGYVISGSNADGIYLEVRDVDTAAASDPRYRYDTPDGFAAGGCVVTGSYVPSTACPNGPSLPLNHARTYTAGTTAPATFLNDPLWYAAKYGGFKDVNNNGLPDNGEWDANVAGTPDNYFLVTNALGLKAQLQKAFDQIIQDAQPVGSAAASGSRYVPSGSLAYQASYLATDWTGDLKAFPLNSDGSLGAAPTWDANLKLPAPAARKVFTSRLSTGAFSGIPFTSTGLTAAGLDTTLMGTLNTTTYNLGDVVAYLRGDQSKETNQTLPGPYRARTSKIGDILDSTPTVAFAEGYGYQNLPATVSGQASGSGSYQTFVSNKSATPYVYVGANDGMLHAFDGSASLSGGKELFSYIPNSVIPKLNRLVQPSYAHTYYVNGTPRLGDVFDGSWKTLLIGATGAGARSVFGLDVTNPLSFGTSNVLWEFNDQLDNDMGVSIGIPSLPTITAAGKWVTAFGNGYNSARNRAELFILDAKTGVKLDEIDTLSGGNSTSANCGLATGPNDCPNGLSSAVMIDSDLDGTGDTIYAGDYLGNLWKFTCTPDTMPIDATHLAHQCTTPWKVGLNGRPLIKAQDSNGLRQPITSGVYAIHNPLGGSIVYFGTGRYLLVNDANPSSGTLINSIYSVWDNPNNTGTTLTRGDLQQQTVTSYSAATGFVGVSSNLFDYEPAFPRTGANSKMGWYLDLVSPSGSDPMTSERVIAAPTGILGSLLVNAFRPTGDLCLPGGQNTFFELNLLNGSAAFSVLPGGSALPPGGTGGSDLGNGPPLGSPNPVISIPGQPGIPSIGCPASDPTCTPPASYCTPDIPGYPRCAPPPWCQPGSACIKPTGCAPGVPGWPYTGACAVAGQECKWFNPGTPVGNLIACRISWRQLR
ncbi:MAG: PilC/PilY family type IV pilus protein [Dokdonella sp.]|uniref:PilC/PilY family type IV pilus protein n=1 Tax=Dokdonella sp. TaxID=2291710 RepID=UPI0032671338